MCQSDSLSQFYPVEAATGSLSWGRGGWRLYLRHRHWSGAWSDCSEDTFESLSVAELLDVLEAVQATWSRPDAPTGV